jgi:PAS domain S-box-containing protein
VSGEIVLEKLIDTLMPTAIEHAGAERGLLILPRGVEQRIEAEAATSGDTITVRMREASVPEAPLPESIVQYVVRTQESVILDDASARSSFAEDLYIHRHHARSILCLPLLKQAKLIGVLYLENNLVPNVFTPTRIAVLKLLASQAAICLENTRLYRDLEEREAKIRRLVDANIMGVFIWDLEGEIIEANEAFLHMLQYSREDLISGRVRWTDLTPVEWRDRDSRGVAEVKATGAIQPYEKEYFRKDGSRVPVLIGAAMFEGSGNEGVAFVLELSEQKRAEEALRASEERWRKLFENSSAGIALCAPDGRFIAANLALQKMLGYTEEELQGRTPLELTFEEDRAATKARIEESAEGRRQVHRIEKRHLRKDGSLVWVDVSTVFVPASANTLAFFAAIIVDITDRKRAEEEIKRIRHLEGEMQQVSRTDMMGRLTASLAHELNQPLAAVRSNAQAAHRLLAAKRPDLEEVKAAIEDVIQDNARAAETIRNVRALFHRDEVQMSPVELLQILYDVERIVRADAASKNVTLRLELPTAVPTVIGNRTQLIEALMNLVLNAFDSVCESVDGPRVVELRASQPEAGRIQVSFRDSGKGIEPEVMPRLFDAFFTTKPKGMGMGLAIVRSIIENHGGRLLATRNVDRGATFEFDLPVKAATRSDRLCY